MRGGTTRRIAHVDQGHGPHLTLARTWAPHSSRSSLNTVRVGTRVLTALSFTPHKSEVFCVGRFACSSWWVLAKIDWLSSRANNVKGGRRNISTRTVEPDAPAGGGNQHNMHAAHACIPYHEICNSILLRVTRAPVLASPDASPHRSASRVPILVAAPPRLSCRDQIHLRSRF